MNDQEIDALEQAARAALDTTEEGGWRRFIEYVDPTEILRLIAAVREADALDVERLAEAIKPILRGTWASGGKIEADWRREAAASIAAAYAALSATEPAAGEREPGAGE